MANMLLTQLQEKRAALKATVDAIIETVAKEERSELTESEDKNLTDSKETIASLDKRIEELSEYELRNAAAIELASKVNSVKEGEVTTPVRVSREERTYRPDTRDVDFIGDVVRSKFGGDYLAAERLQRHAHEETIERRDQTSVNFTGFVVPSYLVDKFADAAREARPFADAIGSEPLNFVSAKYSKGTTGSTVAWQNGENGALNEASPDDTESTLSALTINGFVDVSRQSIDLGQGVQPYVYRDLIAALETGVDAGILVGDGSSGTPEGLFAADGTNTVTYTQAVPKAIDCLKAIADGIQKVQTVRFAPATAIVMHPRRWAWLSSATSAEAPLMGLSTEPPKTFGTSSLAKSSGVVGSIFGVPVIVDANVPTTVSSTRDSIAVTRLADHLFYESPVMTLDAKEVLSGNWTVRLVAAKYVAFTAERYVESTTLINGTGLAAPTFATPDA